MKKHLILLLATGFVFSCKLNAQQLKPVPISYFQGKMQPKIFGQSELSHESMIHSNGSSPGLGMQILPEWNFKYPLPKGAVFCRMEEALYSRLNFWVKIRMGTDERYSN